MTNGIPTEEPVWVEQEAVLQHHIAHIGKYGDAYGLRDAGLLESALNRARNLYAYKQADLYTLAAAYAYGVVQNHPFIDGNKRTAYACMRFFLESNGIEVTASNDEKSETMLNLAAGNLSETELITWLRNNTQAKPPLLHRLFQYLFTWLRNNTQAKDE